MTFKAGYRSRILLGDFALYSKLTQFENALNIDMHDITVFKTDPSKDFLPGTDTSTISAEGFIDADTQTELTAWTDVLPVAFAHEGLALGSPVEICSALQASYTPGSSVAGMASFSINGQATGPSSFGVSLHDLTADTIDGNGTGVDGVAQTTSGGIAQLHVTAFSGLTSAVITVADSANNSTFATIGTFATVTSTTSERIPIAGTIRRYTRYSIDVTGTGSVEFAVVLARH